MWGRCLTKNLKVLLITLVLEYETVMFERQRQYSSLFSKFEADQHKFCELQWSDTTPLISTLTSTWHHAHGSFSQAFSLRFCILQAIKTGSGNGLRMRLELVYLMRTLDVLICFLTLCTPGHTKLYFSAKKGQSSSPFQWLLTAIPNPVELAISVILKSHWV